jgi:hypothetical protein
MLMKRIFVIVVVMLTSFVVPVGAALAQGAEGEGPAPNPHNCGGTSSFGTIEELGGGQEFGGVVSDVAQEGSADNVTHANCDEPPRQNP